MAFALKHGDRPLDGYTIQRAVGRGGFGEVYYAISDGGREVALKYLRENPQIELRGVSHCINLKSPHLVTIFDVKTSADGEYFIVMEYVGGPSLRDLLIAEPNGLGAQKAAFFVRELAKGLSYLHERGIVHRDLKPGNVFYDDGYVKIGDYGLSKFISVSRHSAQTASIGTVHYMAPEVGSGNYSRGIDIYALGVILYEMLLGKVPFDGSTMGEVLMKHLTAQPELDELPEPYGHVIRKALAKDPNERYQNVDEMVGELFDVGDVRDSLVGFNPTSLTQAAARGARDIAASPIPSPNPPPAPAAVPTRPNAWLEPGEPDDRPPIARMARLPEELSRKFRHIGERISERAEALDRKFGRVRLTEPAHPGYGQAAGPVRRSPDRIKRIVLAVLLSVGIAAGVGGIMASVTSGRYPEEAGIAAFLMTLGMGGGLVLAQRVIRWTGSAAQPEWVRRLLMFSCCAPFVGFGAIPLFDRSESLGWAVLIGLGASLVFVDWGKRFRCGAAGELKLGMAFTAGFCAWLVALILGGRMTGPRFPFPEVAWVAGSVAAAASLIVQMVAWFAYGGSAAESAPQTGGRHRTAHEGRGRRRHAQLQAAVGREPPPPPTALSSCAVMPPLGIPITDESRWARMASREPLPRPRWAVTRAFWSVIAFCLFGGMVVTFLIPILIWTDQDEASAAIIGCVACFAFLIFALQKTSQRRRGGAWRDTLRPLLTAACMTGVGAAITGLSMYNYCDDELIGVITGLVAASMLLVVLLISAVVPRKSRPMMRAPLAPGAEYEEARREAGVD